MNSRNQKLLRCGAAVFAAAAAISLTGCGMQTGAVSATPLAMGAISGTVHGGQQPVSNARVFLFAVTNSGYGMQANPILNTNGGYVTTTSGGAFSITGDYNCPSNAQVYLVAIGGNPGLAAGTNNGSIDLAAGLGSCSSLSASTNVTINEISTAALAYAMSGFMSNYTQASTSATNLTGVARAMASIPNMINVASGTVLATTPYGNGTIPVAEINTLADVIAPCVNSNNNDGSCAALFSATNVTSSQVPDTFTAMLNIAHNPTTNVSKIFALSSANAPFQPTLTAAPNDFSVAISYTGGGLTSPYGLTIDPNGDIWVSNPSANSITHLNYLGVPYGAALTGNSLSMPMGIASDTMGNIYAANFTSNTVTKYSSAGIPSTLTGGGLNQPIDLAIDGNRNVYTANQGNNSISQFYINGLPSTTSPYMGGGVNVPSSIAVNGDGSIWTSNNGNSTLSQLAPGNGYISPAGGYMGGGLINPVGLGFDASKNVLVANSTNSVSSFNNSGVANTTMPYSNGGSGSQAGIAVDGAGRIYVTLSGNNALKILTNSGTAYAAAPGILGNLTAPAKVRLDSSANVSVANNGSASTSITEFVGLGAPTAAPLAAGVANGTLGIRP